MGIQIKPVESMEEIEGIVRVQREAWKMSDIGIVPNFETRAVADAGFVYIAVDDDRVIGFIYGYHHFPHWHYSHMMAVVPDYQDRNVGFLLKQYHRQQILSSDFHVEGVRWTVDPLLPNNAYLNFAKLGCIANTYKANYYGDPSRDGVEIYAGLPTDRFLVEWPVHSSRVVRRMSDYLQDRISLETLVQRSPSLNEISGKKCVQLGDVTSTSFTVEVPSEWHELREDNIMIAKDWRIQFREICTSAFEQDYFVVDYHSIIDNSHRRNFYEFSKEVPK